MPSNVSAPAATCSAAPVRVVMLGHVDHGKSTLVGRLLHDTGSLPDGKLDQIRAVSRKRGLELEWAFALDALQAERDQGITIDAAHVWLKAGGRPFEIVDAPGHEEFLKNMITGAASADAALLLIDVREGVREQSRRHALMVQLLGLTQVAVVVNKMDLAGWSEDAFRAVEREFGAYLASAGIDRPAFIPVSAREGENVATRARWHAGPTVVDALLSFAGRALPVDAPLRFAVQDVYRTSEMRVLAGRVESGVVRVGDPLVFSPWNKSGFVKSIERWNRPPSAEARAGESVGIALDAPLYVERGQIGSHLAHAPVETDRFDAKVFWLGRDALAPGRDYLLKVSTQEVPCRVERVKRVVDVASLASVETASVARHQIGEVTIATARPVAVDEGGVLGRFVLHAGARIDGGGIVSLAGVRDLRPELSGLKSANIAFVAGQVTRDERARRTGHRGRVLWFTGLSGSGKTTIATALERRLFDAGFQTYFLDGDSLRHGLSANLGFSEEDRSENVRRVGEVAKLFCDAGAIAIVALISPRRADRDRVRAGLRAGEFVEVFVNAPLEVCERRDPKGIYRKAREGKIASVTGIDAPYEAPEKPEIELRTDASDADACVQRVFDCVRALEVTPGTT